MYTPLSTEENKLMALKTTDRFGKKLVPDSNISESTYSHPQTDCFDVLQQFSLDRLGRFLKLRSKPGWIKHQSAILPLSHEENSASK